MHFTVMAAVSASFSATGVTNYPLVMPPLNSSGSVTVLSSTWNLNTTDNELFQTPLRSPTVFNFYFPDFQYPGILTTAGLVAPEFQLSSDTGVANQMNFLYNATLGTGGGNGNANGFSSFRSGSGAIVLDLGPWMLAAKTSNSGIPGLVDELNTLLLGDQLSSSVRTIIINYVANTTNFPYTTPTTTQMRDRVRAVWESMESGLSHDELRHVSLIMPFTPIEMAMRKEDLARDENEIQRSARVRRPKTRRAG
jgi:hypothetical protein